MTSHFVDHVGLGLLRCHSEHLNIVSKNRNIVRLIKILQYKIIYFLNYAVEAHGDICKFILSKRMCILYCA